MVDAPTVRGIRIEKLASLIATPSIEIKPQAWLDANTAMKADIIDKKRNKRGKVAKKVKPK